ncbi:MAG: carboxypeptidase regulatory-like domain-containing protein [Candidatus Hydrogenedentes bacterium]|nr:carboxypeptidase regulatory-like domain-containing protein [Candidatus Hydrogenedentota bacterium]
MNTKCSWKLPLIAVAFLAAVFLLYYAGRGREPEPTISSTDTRATVTRAEGAPTSQVSETPRIDERNTPSPTVEDPGAIHGVVYRPDGSLAVGARVQAVFVPRNWPPEAPRGEPPAAVAGDSGVFTLESLPLGWHLLQANLGGEAAQETVLLEPGSPVANRAIVLHASGPIAGVVLDPAGTPVADAILSPLLHGGKRISPHLVRGASVRSDPDGRFEFSYVSPGTWDIEAVAEGYAPKRIAEVASGTPDLEIRLEPGLAIAGAVTLDGEPVEGARLLLKGDETPSPEIAANSRADGRFIFGAVGPGDYLLSARKDGNVMSAAPLQLTLSNRPIEDLAIELTPGGIVRGRVLDQESGAGIPGVEVTAMPEAGRSFRIVSSPSAENGAYEITGLSAGNYSLNPGRVAGFPNIGGSRNFPTAGVEPGMIREGIDIFLLRGITVSGRVLDAAGEPVAGADVRGRAQGWQDMGTSGPDGAYTLANIQPGQEITIQATAAGAASSVYGPLFVPPEGLDGIDLALDVPRDGLIAGMVVDSRNRPVVARMAAITSEKGHFAVPNATHTGPDGRFVFPNMPPGAYELTATPGHGEQQTLMALTLKPGQQVRDLRLIYKGGDLLEISGTTVDQDGAPVIGASVTLMKELGERQYLMQSGTRSGPGGAFRFAGLSEGNYRLTASLQGHPTNPGELVSAGDSGVVLVVSGMARLRGVVLRPDGQPVTAFEAAAVGRGAIPGAYGAMNAAWKSFANEHGAFELTVEAGSHDIVARAQGYAVGRAHPPAARPGGLQDDIVITLTPREAVQGRVIGPGGAGVGGAFVFHGPLPRNAMVMASHAPATSGPDGAFSLHAPEPGKPLHLSAIHPVEGVGEILLANTDAPFEIQLVSAAELHVAVTQDGQPVSRAMVTLTFDSGPETIFTNDEGVARRPNAPPGPVHIQAHNADRSASSTETEAELISGHETRVELALD